MNERTYRRVIIGSIGALALIVAVVLIAAPEGAETVLPEPLESLFPLPGDTVVRQTAIEVDLPVGYTLEIEVDGVLIPRIEIGFTEATGQYLWQPGPTSLFEVWEGGDHSVTIRWDRAVGRPDPGEFTWTFRVT